MIVEKPQINNEFYAHLGERWYKDDTHAIALLRREAELKNPWVTQKITEQFVDRASQTVSVLDVGCGAGFLSNYLAQSGFVVTGLDIHQEVLDVAHSYDVSAKVRYVQGSAEALPFAKESFSVVCAMDVLEHVEDPKQVLSECVRVLQPGGILCVHTFNRNWLSKMLVIYGVEWFSQKCPSHVHVYEYFIKPNEMLSFFADLGLNCVRFSGIQPKINAGFFKGIVQRKLNSQFAFRVSKSLSVGYLASAVKSPSENSGCPREII